ncbi:hypothetical protein [Nisaea sp.]|uniref:hypothetical protein n=1 Tax=Nisaea sp. TaxID=2024842 RepID=UPI003B515A24
MADGAEYRFKIDAYTPDTIPMGRLAEYMADLAAMLGEPERVHFDRLEPGSVVLVQKIDPPAVLKVRERVKQINSGSAPTEALRAFERTNSRLKQDNSIGALSEGEGAEVIRFPGREMPEPLVYGPINQDGTLDGQVIVVGGTGDWVPVHISRAGSTFNCHAEREMAKRLAQYIFGKEVRVRGNARWERDEHGIWNLLRFRIYDFQVLDDEPLSGVVARMRAIEGSGWPEIEDPWGELSKMRGEGDEIH